MTWCAGGEATAEAELEDAALTEAAARGLVIADNEAKALKLEDTALTAKALPPPPPPPATLAHGHQASHWQRRGGWFSKAHALAEQVLQDEGVSVATRTLAEQLYAGPDETLGR